MLICMNLVSRIREIPVAAVSPLRFSDLIGHHKARELDSAAARIAGMTVWNINSTARGGGVAEMLRSLVPYARGAGVDVRWVVIDGPPEFFRVTKRLHHALHGSCGDASPLDDAAREAYEKTLRGVSIELRALVRPGDVAILHDPQTAGLIPSLARSGVRVVWRCHVGSDTPNDEVEGAWRFRAP